MNYIVSSRQPWLQSETLSKKQTKTKGSFWLQVSIYSMCPVPLEPVAKQHVLEGHTLEQIILFVIRRQKEEEMGEWSEGGG